MKFNDLDGDGVKDQGEPLLSGWTVNLCADSACNTILQTTTTGANGAYSFSVTPDADKTTPANDPYYVREVNQSGWTQTAPTTVYYGPLTISAATPQYLNQDFGNQKDQGYLKISKIFDPKTSGFSGNFTIQYNCGAGDQTVQLAAGASTTVGPFDAGTNCTVSEPTVPTAPTGWAFGSPTLNPSNGQVTIVKGNQASAVTVTVTNTITRNTGSLKIKKIFDAGSSGFGGTFAINYDCNDGTAHDGTANLAAGGETTITGIPTGTLCTVTEPSTPTPPAGWTFGTPTLSDNQAPTDDGKVTINDKDATYTVEVTNTITRNTGSLKIKKIFDAGSSGFGGTFAINYDCNDGTAHDGTANLAAGGETTITGIPTGTLCTVTEPSTPTPPAGWTFGTPTLSDNQAPTDDGKVTINDKDATYTVEVTNTITRNTGSLKIKKIFDAGSSGFGGTFAINYDCNDGTAHDGTANLAAGGETTIIGIPTGTQCTVTEPSTPTPPTGWTFGTPTLSDNQAPTDDGKVTINDKDATYTVEVTNTITRDHGSLKIKKIFDAGSSGFGGTFAINYDCNDGTAHDGTANLAAGGETTISGIPTGTLCTVTEPSTPTPPAGWTFGTPTLSDNQAPTDDGKVTINDKDATYTVEVTNTITRDTGSLTIVKKVVNDNGGSATVNAFGLNTTAGSLTFDAGVANGTTTTYTSQKLTVVTETYTLKENDVYGYAEGTWSCTGAAGTVVPTFDNGSVRLARARTSRARSPTTTSPARSSSRRSSSRSAR